VQGGNIQTVLPDGTEKTIRLTRAHLEEDAGKSLHEDFHGMTGIDLNRAGTPLLEIVSEPDMRSAGEAVAYVKTLHALVRWIDICDGNMQEGSFRCDANVSVRPRGSDRLGTRCEIKNLNSFRFLEHAIDFEVRRQIGILEDGGRIDQETRLYDPDRDETRSLRSKEEAHDYRYFPDPDLLPLEVGDDWVAKVRAALPALPAAKRDRYVHELGLTAYDAAMLTGTRETADYFDALIAALAVREPGADRRAQAKAAANWVMGELAGALNRAELEIDRSSVSAQQLAGLIARIRDNTISGKIAKEVFDALWAGEASGDDAADAIIQAKGLRQITDAGALESIIDGIIAANPAQVAEFRSGREKAFNFFVGQAMKATKGKGSPAQITEILRRKLAG
jgi:aspartyl-tRNA(Asn)/glutamyl-tRNA(Gln) amidotransferase subunit B